jgi:hypothetical protein
MTFVVATSAGDQRFGVARRRAPSSFQGPRLSGASFGPAALRHRTGFHNVLSAAQWFSVIQLTDKVRVSLTQSINSH